MNVEPLPLLAGLLTEYSPSAREVERGELPGARHARPGV